jgi:hypothetical protein
MKRTVRIAIKRRTDLRAFLRRRGAARPTPYGAQGRSPERRTASCSLLARRRRDEPGSNSCRGCCPRSGDAPALQSCSHGALRGEVRGRNGPRCRRRGFRDPVKGRGAFQSARLKVRRPYVVATFDQRRLAPNRGIRRLRIVRQSQMRMAVGRFADGTAPAVDQARLRRR